MGVSTDGQLSYGISFEEEYEFPWTDLYDEDDNELTEEDWWLKENNFVNPFEYPFNIHGEYKPGMTKKDYYNYYKFREDYLKTNPFPVEIVTHCSFDYPMYILAVKGKHFYNNRGYPVVINPEDLVVSDEEKQKLLDFCSKYNIIGEGEPEWHLSSLWG